MRKLYSLSTIAVASLLVSGCASIVDGGRKSVQINSEPAGAKFTIYNAKGRVIDCATTPAKVKLARSQGYFQPAEYKVTFEAPGFYTGETYIEGKLDGWYFGNIAIGGILGFVVVDPLTGSMYTLSPRQLSYTLLPTSLNIKPEDLKAQQFKANPIDKPASTKAPETHNTASTSPKSL